MNKIYQLAMPQRMIEGRHGFFVYNKNDTYIGTALELYGEYCEHEVDLFAKLVSEGDTILEIGANCGSQTVPLSKFVGNTGRVYAFEPQPVVFQNLCANLSINGVHNVRAFPFACGNKNGSIFLPNVNYHDAGNFGMVQMQESGTERVTLVKLDDLFKMNEKIKFIKIDVEGMESPVISGLSEIINHFKPSMYVENNGGDESKVLIELIWSLGYKIYWHITYYYNENNFYKNPINIYKNIASFNMLCLHQDAGNITGLDFSTLQLIEDSSAHPLKR